MKTLLHCTSGLRASKNGKSKLVKVYFYETDEGVRLEPTSAYNLTQTPGKVPVISKEEYANRPVNPYNGTREAIWALGLCGWVV